MKKSNIFLWIAGVALLFGSCKKDNVIKDDQGKEPVIEKKDSIFVLVGKRSTLGADILFTSKSLDEGTLVTKNTGVQQNGADRNYTVNSGQVFSLLFNQSRPGTVTAYHALSDGSLAKTSDFQTETMTCFGNMGNDILMMRNAWEPEEEYTRWYRLNAQTREIIAQGEINANKISGNGEKAFFTDLKQVGNKVFASFWSIESGKTFTTTLNPDTSYVAVYDYPSMKLEKVIKDNRGGAIGNLMIQGMDVDEKGDIYAINNKFQYQSVNKKTNYGTNPVSITKIKKGTTDFDKSFFINLSKELDDQYVWRKQYLGKGYFLFTVAASNFIYGTLFYGGMLGGFKFAVVNVYDGSFKWVSGLPDQKDVKLTTGDYGYSDLDGSGYMGVYYTENKLEKSTVYKIDGKTATAKAGLVTDGGGAITGILKIPVK